MGRFDQEWCDGLQAAVGSPGLLGGAHIALLYVITDTADGKVAFNVVDDSTALTATAGKFPRGVKADITVTAKEAVLQDVWSGSRTREAAFMAGDLKVEGAYARWLDDLIPAFTTTPWLDAWAVSSRA